MNDVERAKAALEQLEAIGCDNRNAATQETHQLAISTVDELVGLLGCEDSDEIEVEVDAEKHVKDPQLIVSLYDESTTEIVKGAVGDDVDVGAHTHNSS